jgi:hypothetical protein
MSLQAGPEALTAKDAKVCWIGGLAASRDGGAAKRKPGWLARFFS